MKKQILIKTVNPEYNTEVTNLMESGWLITQMSACGNAVCIVFEKEELSDKPWSESEQLLRQALANIDGIVNEDALVNDKTYRIRQELKKVIDVLKSIDRRVR